MKISASIRIAFSMLFLSVACGAATVAQTVISPVPKPIVTFIELGSVSCVPCKAMQPVMESIRRKYPEQVSVLFYDVWTKEGRPYGQKYRIRVIPTQVFLDKDGKEYYRHEGFFPEAELLKILEKGGVRL
jgi:thioredoxin 1